MRLIPTIRLGLALAVCASLTPAMAAPAKTAPKPAAKPVAKPAAKPHPKPSPKPVAGKTPSETVKNLIAAMKVRDAARIGAAFDWPKLTKEMNTMLAGQKGLDQATYKTLFVEMLNVEPSVSKNLSVGKETMKGKETATVEMRRFTPDPDGKGGQTRTINTLTLTKTKAGWKIYRLDSAAQPVTPAAAPLPPRAPQGMVPAAGADKH